MKVKFNNVNVFIGKDQNEEIYKKIKENGIAKKDIKSIKYLKRSIDSRKKESIKIVYNLELELKKNIDISTKKAFQLVTEKSIIERKAKKVDGTIAIIGTGPSGLFSALRLAELGFETLIFERGEKVEDRIKTVDKFWSDSILNENSNAQFGEGGAGTFSDGKLTARGKSPYKNRVFDEFVSLGANKDILYDYKPHIGTDVLRNVVKNLRNKIEKLGGKFYFNSTLTNIVVENEKISQIIINDSEKIDVSHLILGIGHSARDTYKMLHENGVAMENKDFAIGTRIEHPREAIDKMQYGRYHNHSLLGSAPYQFVYNNKQEQRGVFTFCPCPGGEIINASSINNTSLVNGMSNKKRNGLFTNSAVVVSVNERDYGKELFAGMKLQEEIEKKSYEIMKIHGALYQNLLDFTKGKTTKNKIKSSYTMELESYDLNKIFPANITRNLKKAFNSWSKNEDFISKEANLIGTETRTSAPLRILRDKQGVSISIKNLYPIGEGAGYAGGIISAAIDGITTVDMNFTEEK